MQGAGLPQQGAGRTGSLGRVATRAGGLSVPALVEVLSLFGLILHQGRVVWWRSRDPGADCPGLCHKQPPWSCDLGKRTRFSSFISSAKRWCSTSPELMGLGELADVCEALQTVPGLCAWILLSRWLSKYREVWDWPQVTWPRPGQASTEPRPLGREPFARHCPGAALHRGGSDECVSSGLCPPLPLQP